MSDIKIMALGGVRENGKNLYAVEVNDSIFVLDAGLKYPENEQLGVDVVIPNLDYLIENKNVFRDFLNPWTCGCYWCIALYYRRSQSTCVWLTSHN